MAFCNFQSLEKYDPFGFTYLNFVLSIKLQTILTTFL